MPGERESVAGDESWPITDEKNKSKEAKKKSSSSFLPIYDGSYNESSRSNNKIDAVTLDVHI